MPLRVLLRLGAGLAVLGALAGHAGAQQRGPIQLFPDLSPTRPAPAAPQAPAEPGAPAQALPDPLSPRAEPAIERVTPDPVAPPATPTFQVERLDAPDIGVIGLEGGFAPEVWRGSDAQIVLDLLAHLPVETTNPALRDLTRRLLITGAALDGGGDSGRLLELRIDRLIAMGQLGDAAALLDRLPTLGEDSPLARQAAEVALWQGDDGRACTVAEQIAPGSNHAFWAKLVVLCRLQAGDAAGAMLGLDLLRDAGDTEDEVFFQLADMIASGELGRALPPLAGPSALHVAMLRRAGLPLPESALASPSPPLVAAIAETPALAPGRELEMAEAAFHAGVLSDEELVRRYLELAPGGDDYEALVGTGEWGPEARAHARAQVNEPDAVARGELLDALWRASSGADRILVGRAFADPFAELPVGGELIFAAPSSARALLVAGRPLVAAQWFSLMQDVAGGEGRLSGAALAPLFSLAGVGGRAQVPEPDLESLAAWRSSTGAPESEVLRLYALVEGVGVRVPTRAWWDLLDAAADGPANAPLAPFWRALDHAQADRRVGEGLLLALHALGGNGGEVHPEAVVRSLRALRALGFDQEARAIALADAVAHDL